jgi:hypothetical protein
MLKTALPKKGPMSQPPVKQMTNSAPRVINWSMPTVCETLTSSSLLRTTAPPATMHPMPNSTDDTRLMRRRILRSSRKRFHVRPLAVVGAPAVACWPAVARVESARTMRTGRRRADAVLEMVWRMEAGVKAVGRAEERKRR